MSLSGDDAEHTTYTTHAPNCSIRKNTMFSLLVSENIKGLRQANIECDIGEHLYGWYVKKNQIKVMLLYRKENTCKSVHAFATTTCIA